MLDIVAVVAAVAVSVARGGVLASCDDPAFAFSASAKIREKLQNLDGYGDGDDRLSTCGVGT